MAAFGPFGVEEDEAFEAGAAVGAGDIGDSSTVIWGTD